MSKFEIAKKTYIEVLIYGLIGVLVLSLSVIAWVEIPKESSAIVLLFVIATILFVAFKIVPNLSIKKHVSLGLIDFCPDRLIIENTLREKREILIRDIDNLSLKLIGFDGQQRFVDSREVKTTAYLPNSNPLNGLGNRLQFTFNDGEFKYEFYVGSIDDYNELKELVKDWPKLNRKIRIDVIR